MSAKQEIKKQLSQSSENPYYLLIISTSYLLAAANEYWTVNWFKQFGVRIPLYFAILQNSSWPLQLFIYLRECKTLPEKRVITPQMYRSYAILGCLAAFINLTRMFSLATLPPVLTVISSNTEIVFETAMSIFILKKPVSLYQYTAVVLVLLGVLVALWDPVSMTFGGGQQNSSGSGQISPSLLLIAVCVSIMSRFASSLNTILAEKFLGKNAKSKIGVKECTLVNSIVPFCILPFGLLATKEYQLWPAQLYYTGSVRNTVIIAFLSFALCESKHLDRFSKYAIVENTSTIFFAGVDSAMKMLAGIMSFVFFPSTTPNAVWPTIVGFLFIAIAVTLLYIDKRMKAMAEEAAKKLVADDANEGGIEMGGGTNGTDDQSSPAFNPLTVDHRRTNRVNSGSNSTSLYMLVRNNEMTEGNTSGDSSPEYSDHSGTSEHNNQTTTTGTASMKSSSTGMEQSSKGSSSRSAKSVDSSSSSNSTHDKHREWKAKQLHLSSYV